ncbi:hypothetical protein D3C75_1183890 [compost metagenome]
MINWIKYDPANPPAQGVYLVSDGEYWTPAFYDKEDAEWWPEISIIGDSDVTHYAHINLPGEETDNA